MYLFKECLELAGRGSSAADVIMSEASTDFRSAVQTAKEKGEACHSGHVTATTRTRPILKHHGNYIGNLTERTNLSVSREIHT